MAGRDRDDRASRRRCRGFRQVLAVFLRRTIRSEPLLHGTRWECGAPAARGFTLKAGGGQRPDPARDPYELCVFFSSTCNDHDAVAHHLTGPACGPGSAAGAVRAAHFFIRNAARRQAAASPWRGPYTKALSSLADACEVVAALLREIRAGSRTPGGARPARSPDHGSDLTQVDGVGI